MAKIDGQNQIMAGTVTSADLANTGVGAGSYTADQNHSLTLILNSQGQVTSASTGIIATAIPLVTAGSTVGQTLRWNGSQYVAVSNLLNDGTNLTASGNLSVGGSINITDVGGTLNVMNQGSMNGQFANGASCGIMQVWSDNNLYFGSFTGPDGTTSSGHIFRVRFGRGNGSGSGLALVIDGTASTPTMNFPGNFSATNVTAAHSSADGTAGVTGTGVGGAVIKNGLVTSLGSASTVPAGTATGQTLYWNGSAYVASLNLYNNGSRVEVSSSFFAAGTVQQDYTDYAAQLGINSDAQACLVLCEDDGQNVMISNGGGSILFYLSDNQVATLNDAGQLILTGALYSAGVNSTGNATFDCTGSTTTAPRTLGMSNMGSGTAARFQIGDYQNCLQTAAGDSLQIVSFWGLELVGNQQGAATGTGYPFRTINNAAVTVTVNPPAVTGSDKGLVINGRTGQVDNLFEANGTGGSTKITNTGMLTSPGAVIGGIPSPQIAIGPAGGATYMRNGVAAPDYCYQSSNCYFDASVSNWKFDDNSKPAWLFIFGYGNSDTYKIYRASANTGSAIPAFAQIYTMDSAGSTAFNGYVRIPTLDVSDTYLSQNANDANNFGNNGFQAKMTNYSATGQSAIGSVINGTFSGKVRFDYAGNVNIHSGVAGSGYSTPGSTGSINFILGADGSTTNGTYVMSINTTGVSTTGLISANNTNYGPPSTLTAGSTNGYKVQLYTSTVGVPAVTDYALGVEANNMWFTANGGFKFYNAALSSPMMSITAQDGTHTGGYLTLGAMTAAPGTTSGGQIYYNGTDLIAYKSGGTAVNLTSPTGGGGGGISGAGTAGQVAYWSGSSAITGTSSFQFNSNLLTAPKYRASMPGGTDVGFLAQSNNYGTGNLYEGRTGPGSLVFYVDTNGVVGSSSHTITYNTNDYQNFSAADHHITLINGNASGQTAIGAVTNGIYSGKVRFDYAGNMNFHSGVNGSSVKGYFTWYAGDDGAYSIGDQVMELNPDGQLQLGTVGPSTGTARLLVRPTSASQIGIQTPYSTSAPNEVHGSFYLQGYGINNGWLGDNTYFNGTSFVYGATGYMAMNYFLNGTWDVRVGPSGSAGAAVPSGWGNTSQMRVNNDGSVGILGWGTTYPTPNANFGVQIQNLGPTRDGNGAATTQFPVITLSPSSGQPSYINVGNGAGYFGNAGSGANHFFTDDSNGDVGIRADTGALRLGKSTGSLGVSDMAFTGGLVTTNVPLNMGAGGSIAGTKVSGSALTVVQNAGSKSKGILFTGATLGGDDGSTTNGVFMRLNFNSTTGYNRQLIIGPTDAVASTTQAAFRFVFYNGQASIDGISGDGTTRTDMFFGSDTTNMGMGVTNGTAIPSTAKVYVQLENSKSFVILPGGSQTANLITAGAFNVGPSGIIQGAGYKSSDGSAGATGTGGGGDTIKNGLVTALGAAGLALTSTTPTAEASGSTGAVGTATTAARADHVHAMPSIPLLVELCAGFTPAATGADIRTYKVPYHSKDGTTSVTYNVRRVEMRTEVADTGTTTIQIERSTGTGAFSAASMLSAGLSITGSGVYENYALQTGTTQTITTTTVSSGDKLRINFTALDAVHANFTISVLLQPT